MRGLRAPTSLQLTCKVEKDGACWEGDAWAAFGRCFAAESSGWSPKIDGTGRLGYRDNHGSNVHHLFSIRKMVMQWGHHCFHFQFQGVSIFTTKKLDPFERNPWLVRQAPVPWTPAWKHFGLQVNGVPVAISWGF